MSFSEHRGVLLVVVYKISLRKYTLGRDFSRHHKYFQVESSEKMRDKSKLVYSPCGLAVVTGDVAGVRIHLEEEYRHHILYV